MKKDLVVIYVALLDEGTACWRPVQAEHIDSDHFKIVDVMPDDEVWEFQSGAIVRCREHVFADGKGLVAIEKIG